jgi:segregation and condensation protein A
MTPEADSAEPLLEGTRAGVGNAGAPVLRFEAWEGPLDLLLDLARAQRVDLAQLSIVTLAEQFAAVVDAAIAARRVPLSRLAEWLIMAAWLTLLRSRLLLPVAEAEAAEAQREAADLRQRLASREAARRLADWLERRPQLGREVFGRGEAERPCCTGHRRGRTEPYPRCGLRDADVLRPSEFEHAVQHVGGNRHLGRLAPVRLRA